ncbi:retrovirus-related pol polyprotein from transposon RE1 [Tanacetum coccineum]|uniref:Retrovirus-related pol polyprotein from transposon RE1 n=1 Tax=Tanacetum coccineum TaxID=301880 RepID=A0ABQ5DAH0_9ASTR
MAPQTTIQITAATHFPIRLTANNFPVWRRQVESTLIGLELDAFIIGNQQPPKRFLDDKDGPRPNPQYLPCFASGSRSRVISLKSKLVKIPKGTRSIAEYLPDMRAIADDLALAQSPITDEDLLVHILSQLGDDYGTIVAAIKVRETPLSYSELFDKLTDFKRALKEQIAIPEPVLTTANYIARQSNRQPGGSDGFNQQRSTNNRFSYQQRNPTNHTQWSSSASGGNQKNRSNSFCQFFNIPGHMTRDCRKLSQFLRENNVTINTSESNASNAPVANVTMSGSPSASPTWLFDSGASNHVTGDRSTLQNVSDYGGPDEIILGNGLSSNLSDMHCPSCSINKSHKLPFGSNSFVVTKPLQLFKLLVEKFFQTPLVSIFTDNGGEYLGLLPFLKTHGISHYTTPPHTPEQNGVAERRHRHIVETGLALMHRAKLPLSFWSHAFQTVVYLINRLPTPILNNHTLYQHLFGQPPNYTKLKPFGCLCYPWLRPYTTAKLQPRSTHCLFLRYSTSKSAYKCYDPTTHRLYHSRHVQFVENLFPSQTDFTKSLPTPDDYFMARTSSSHSHSISQSPLNTADTNTPTSKCTLNHPLHPTPSSTSFLIVLWRGTSFVK